MASRPTIEMSKKDADKRKIKEGDLCRIYNDVGETYAHAIIMDSMLEGVASTQKQYKGSLVKNGVNANALKYSSISEGVVIFCFIQVGFMVIERYIAVKTHIKKEKLMLKII